MLAILPIIAAYLLGAIPFGLIVSRLAGVDDIRRVGSGNIGATNVWRASGFKVAVWVFIGDIGKGVLAVLIGRWYVAGYAPGYVGPDVFLVACALAAIIGHVFPVFLAFKGGKGVNTALGAFVTLLPIETVIAFGVFVIVVLIFRYVSLGSIVGAVGFCAVLVIEKFALEKPVDMVYVYLSILLVLLIVVTHRHNISRLVKGTENRFSFSSGKDREQADG